MAGFRRKADVWGRAGSGILFYCEKDGTVLLLLRSGRVMDPGIWGIPGGAVKGTEGFYDEDDAGADFSEAELYGSAVEETNEEMGFVPNGDVVGKATTEKGNFVYTTFVVRVDEATKSDVESKIKLNWENDDYEWFRIDRLPPDTHPGVVAAVSQFMKSESDKARNNAVWWHGDTSKRTSFHGQIMDRPSGDSRNALGPGIYFTTNFNQAVGYSGPGGWVYGAKINSDRFFDDNTKPTAEFLRRLINKLPKEKRNIGLSNWDENPDRALSLAAKAYAGEPTMLAAVVAVRNDFFNDSNEWTSAMVKCGYDGFIHHLGLGTTHLMVYNPDVIQITSEKSYESLTPSHG